ncbi:tRNA 5-hydroxyuridine modification protein YegQ [uncultured Deefgea sp.]|uniref:prephenate-dependent tRNA uridine(34) hydroxylase TrhP n=1 Tax=uncultured Deefgea sp. TaxID=1304914 RepID=UPI002630252B|nr:tRNA 5-hydroxyuridine modification protein YegQ [uncultured Deefgea sp.]
MTLKAPELLLPAGTLEKMSAAYDFGADAVYAGQPRYSLRARNNDFKLEQIGQGIEEAHARGKKFFVASNILPHNAKVKTYLADMEPVIAMKPDALIMADPGLIMMVREKWPEQVIHLSVQANTVNYAGVKFWKSMGLERVILSRELSLDEIEEIRQLCPDMEIEVFVHGALCIAYSGRCLLSGYFNHRDPNQGTCTNACRWDYKTHDTNPDDAGDVQLKEQVIQFDFNKAMNDANQVFSACGGQERHPLADKTYLIEEANRPGELMPIVEDEHGTYIMNSKDLRAVQHIERLVKMGIDSLKIEGRTKSLYYVARTAQVYRQAIDDAVAGRPFNPALLADLDGLANRGYTDGFYQRHTTHETQNYLDGHSKAHRSQYVGEVLNIQDGWAEIEVKNKFSVGDSLEIIHPSGNIIVKLEQIRGKNGALVESALGSGAKAAIPLDAKYANALLARLF